MATEPGGLLPTHQGGCQQGMGGPKEQDAPAAEAATAAKENGHGPAAPPESNRWTEVNGRPRPSGRENRPANLPVTNGSIGGSGGSGGSVGAPPPAAMKQQRRRSDRHPNGNMVEQPVCRDMDALRCSPVPPQQLAT